MTVDLDTLLGRPGAVGGELGGVEPLDPEACRRLACHSAVTRVLVTRDRGDASLANSDLNGSRVGGPAQAALALLPQALGAPTPTAGAGPLHPGRLAQPTGRPGRPRRGCVFPGCDRPLSWCEGHHLWHWLDGGPTDLANLALVCRAHHRAVHEGGWRLERLPDGRLTATPPRRRPRTAA